MFGAAQFYQKAKSSNDIEFENGTNIRSLLQFVVVTTGGKNMKYIIIACMIACGMAASVSAQQFLFEDDFSENRNQWPEWQDEKSSASVKDGKYILENKNEKEWFWVSRLIGMDLRQDFEIETVLTKTTGVVMGDFIGIKWNVNEKETHGFRITYRGWLGYGKWVEGKENWQNLLNWKQDNAIKQTFNMPNVLLVKKSGDRIQFFINNKSVGKAKFKGETATYLQIEFEGKATIEVDKIRVKYTYKKTVLGGWLGVQMANADSEPAKQFGIKETSGAFIVEIVKNSPAERAGILMGDVIAEFDGKPIDKFETLRKLVASTAPEKTVPVTLIRNGAKQTLQVTLGENAVKPVGQPLDALAQAELEKYAQAAAAATATPTPVPTALPTSTPTPVVAAIKPTPTPLPLATATPVPTLAPTAAPTLAEKKLALLIGNGAYPDAPLQNPANDARAMAAALKRLGFDVIVKEDAGQKEMKQTIDQFGQALKDYDVGVFFYSGHGVQVNGQNYLIPVDADPKSVNDVEYDCVNAGRVLGKMEDAGNTTNIIILDACRNNPFERGWTRSAQGNGLAFMNAPSGSLIAYATSPGNVAYDATEGVNSPYTAALLQHLETPNISILEMFQRVRGVVMKATDKQQIPWESTSLMGNFYFNPK